MGTITFLTLEDLARWFSLLADGKRFANLTCEVIYHEDRNVWVCHVQRTA